MYIVTRTGRDFWESHLYISSSVRLGPTPANVLLYIHHPTRTMPVKTRTWISLWFLISSPIVLWDAGYCFARCAWLCPECWIKADLSIGRDHSRLAIQWCKSLWPLLSWDTTGRRPSLDLEALWNLSESDNFSQSPVGIRKLKCGIVGPRRFTISQNYPDNRIFHVLTKRYTVHKFMKLEMASQMPKVCLIQKTLPISRLTNYIIGKKN